MPTSLADLISQGYTFALSVVGLCVFFMFLYAGLQVMIPGLGGRSAAIKIARDAIIGTILLFSAYIILNSINHDLVEQTGTIPENSTINTTSGTTGGTAGTTAGGLVPTSGTFTGGGGGFGGGGASGNF